MKVLGIITEYNPFHNGHEYHIKKAKEITKADAVIVLMSGSFTQSGNIAICDKFTRAKIAIEHGADVVLELPYIYANSSAESFASNAIFLLHQLNVIDFICFGSETSDITILKNISHKILENESNIWKKTQNYLKNGISFAKARELALAHFLTIEEIATISSSNNILGLEYINELQRLNSTIIPFLIQRSDTYNQNYTSATHIREMLNGNDFDKIQDYVPSDTFNLLQEKKWLNNEALFPLLKYKIMCLSTKELQNIAEISEGFENRIKNYILKSNHYEEFIHELKTKRYQMSRIKRILNNILLDHTKDMQRPQEYYAHVLAISNNKSVLSQIAKHTKIPLITSLSNVDLNIKQHYMLSKDILSANIFNMLKKEQINQDYTNKL